MTDELIERCGETYGHDIHTWNLYDDPTNPRRCPGIPSPQPINIHGEIERERLRAGWSERDAQLRYAEARIAELTEQLQLTNIDAFNNAAEVAELTEMLTAATDTAVQRGKTIDELAATVVYWRDSYYRLTDSDGG